MNKKFLFPLVLFLLFCSFATAQESLRIGGLNEAGYIYRTAADSLNSYFRNSFAFNLSHRNFGFGMKFIAELPKYSTNQAELLQDIGGNDLALGWKELYAYYQKDAFKIHAGTISETFGNGIIFRSWEDLELDQDNRMDGFLLRYDENLKLKTLYAAIASPNNSEKYDLAYGVDAQYPILSFFSLGASAMTQRSFTYVDPLSQRDKYDQRDILGSRLELSYNNLEVFAEYAYNELYYPNTDSGITKGDALYGGASFGIHPFLFGANYKKYDRFNYRLQDMPLANHHSEPLADDQASGMDEEGLQGFFEWAISDAISFKTDYAEAWNAAETKKMNDWYSALEYVASGKLYTLEYSHVEKLDDLHSKWQIERTPVISAGFSPGGKSVSLKAEYKQVQKQIYDDETTYYEPKLQLDMKLGKLALSVGSQTRWEEPTELMQSKYSTALELQYPVFEHSDLTFFAGKESGGKICRNGICRYVAPFQGIRAELRTRF